MKCIWIINQYASTPDTGAVSRHYDLARELARKGHAVYLITASYHHLLRTDQAEPDPGLSIVDGINLVRVPTLKYRHARDKRRVLNWLLFAWRVTRLERFGCRAPDVVLCSSPSVISFLGAEWIARRFNCRLVFEVRDIWPLTLVEVGGMSPRNPAVRFMQWVEDRAYRLSDRVVSNLPRAVEHMASRGMDRDKFCWIPNGFSQRDVDEAQPLPKRVMASFPQRRFTVGYAGTLGAANAMDTFIDAAAILRSHHNIAFVLVGSGAAREELVEKARNLKLENVSFVDSVPKSQVQSILQQFDICYVGSIKSNLYRFGASPNKLFDYLLSGKPIIYGIDTPGYTPVLDFKAGVQVPPQDPVALASAVLELQLMSAADRRAMGDNGRKAVLEHHEYAMLAARLESVLLPETEGQLFR